MTYMNNTKTPMFVTCKKVVYDANIEDDVEKIVTVVVQPQKEIEVVDVICTFPVLVS